MWSKCLVIGLVVIAVAISSPPVGFADTLVYTSGATNGTISTSRIDYPISQTYSQEFTVASPVTLTTATAGLWAYKENPDTNLPLTLDWAIGTAHHGTDIATGTGATLTNVWLRINSTGAYNVYNSSFSFGGVNLSAGSYWLSLGNATQTGTNWYDVPRWDQQPGSASSKSIGPDGSQFYPMSFSVYGVPEPSSLALIGAALLGAGIIHLRRRKGA